ncbi:MAG: LysE family translocator, partial [Nitrosopumilus sp.]|nr:LysE family translocator [Nitrosopumilus sp.]
MVEILEFAVLVIVISASGVMAPGPLFAATVSYGLRKGTRAGLKIAIGHTIVELPLVILLGIGVFSLEI